jgi:hypothetical protein
MYSFRVPPARSPVGAALAATKRQPPRRQRLLSESPTSYSAPRRDYRLFLCPLPSYRSSASVHPVRKLCFLRPNWCDHADLATCALPRGGADEIPRRFASARAGDEAQLRGEECPSGSLGTREKVTDLSAPGSYDIVAFVAHVGDRRKLGSTPAGLTGAHKINPYPFAHAPLQGLGKSCALTA